MFTPENPHCAGFTFADVIVVNPGRADIQLLGGFITRNISERHAVP
jgi:hypothetical protein